MSRPVTPRHDPGYRYPGLPADLYGGMTDIGAIIRDAWALGVLPEDQDCKGWSLDQIHDLRAEVDAAWARYGNRFESLPPALKQRYLRIQEAATRRGREHGWRPGGRQG